MHIPLVVQLANWDWRRCNLQCTLNPVALLIASWTLEELSKVVKMPVALLRRRMSVWLQQGVLREEPPGTFSVIEEERPQDRDNMVLIDSDDESDSGMASQADQKEEELLVCWSLPHWAGGGPSRWLTEHAWLLFLALLDIHPGHVDQPGEPLSGAHL